MQNIDLFSFLNSNEVDNLLIPVTVFGQLQPFTQTMSKARLRLFYKGVNRNGSYIDDQFAEKLLSTLSYAPIKGIYDEQNGDYLDHGKSNDEGRIYGVVPEQPNVSWESFLDEDGVERTYATCDVLLYTAMYKEANEIVGKSQSMELFRPSIKGEWVIVEGKKVFHFTDAVFFGLQVLGDNVEPCFEGAAFFTAYKNLLQMFEEIKDKTLKYSNGGKLNMLNFKVSDSQKFDAIWTLLNTEYNEENGWLITYGIQAIYDDYALVFNYVENRYERVKYTKDDENNMVSLGEVTPVYFIDVTETEKAAVEKLRESLGGSFELVNEKYQEGQDAINQNAEYSTKISELEESISTLNTDRENAVSALETRLAEVNETYTRAQTTISTLTEENESLKAYKLANDKAKKQEIIESYASLLPASIIDEFTAKVDDYEDDVALDKDLAYALKNSNLSVFAKAPKLIPKPEQDENGTLVELLSQYKK